MRKLLLASVSILITSLCYAQEITKDGFGPLKWGASVAEAEKALPGSKKEDLHGTSRWLVAEGMPCEVRLWPNPGKNNPQVTLYFYADKLVGVTSQYHTKAVATEAVSGYWVSTGLNTSVSRTFAEELTERITKTLGDSDQIYVKVTSEPPAAAGKVSVTVRLQVSNRELVQAGLKDIKKRVEQQKDELLTDVPKALLNP